MDNWVGGGVKFESGFTDEQGVGLNLGEWQRKFLNQDLQDFED